MIASDVSQALRDEMWRVFTLNFFWGLIFDKSLFSSGIFFNQYRNDQAGPVSNVMQRQRLR